MSGVRNAVSSGEKVKKNTSSGERKPVGSLHKEDERRGGFGGRKKLPDIRKDWKRR